MLFCAQIEAAGEELFALTCNRDLEGIVVKHKFGPRSNRKMKLFIPLAVHARRVSCSRKLHNLQPLGDQNQFI